VPVSPAQEYFTTHLSQEKMIPSAAVGPALVAHVAYMQARGPMEGLSNTLQLYERIAEHVTGHQLLPDTLPKPAEADMPVITVQADVPQIQVPVATVQPEVQPSVGTVQSEVQVPVAGVPLRMYVPVAGVPLRMYVPVAGVPLRMYVPVAGVPLQMYVPVAGVPLRMYVPVASV
jgi:hypothetical protein